MAGSQTQTCPQRLEEEEERGGDEGIEEELDQNKRTQKRVCDFCGESLALLYCRADTAKLCFSCDREVHSGNPLFGKHTRSQLCDGCNSSPATICCSTESLVLCQNCDWDAHGPSLSSLHDRRPIEGFSGCPSATELSSILGFEDVGDKSFLLGANEADGYLVGSGFYGQMGPVEGISDLFVWETPPVVSLDDLIVSSNSSHNFEAMGIPPLPKNRNTACGKHKEDILSQLCELAKSEHSLNFDHGNVKSLLGFHPWVPEPNIHPRNMDNMDAGFEHDVEPILLPGYEASTLQWHGDCGEAAQQVPIPITLFKESLLVLDNPAEVDGTGSCDNDGHTEQLQKPIIKESLQVLPKFGPCELTGHDRDTVISRYKEKRKTRRYDKQIRYESRKARAESRTRVKGRFAKVDR